MPQNNIDLRIIGTETHENSAIGSMIRARFYPSLERMLTDGIILKSFAAGPYHIWDVIQIVAAMRESVESPTAHKDVPDKNTTTSRGALMHVVLARAVVHCKQNFNTAGTLAAIQDRLMFKYFVCHCLKYVQSPDCNYIKSVTNLTNRYPIPHYLSNNILGECMQRILSSERIIHRFYQPTSPINRKEVRQRIIQYCMTISKLPFALNMAHREMYTV